MKWQTLALAFLTSTGLASPIVQRDTPKVYALRLVSKTPSLNNKYLATNGNGALVGVYKDSPSILKFVPVPVPGSSSPDLYELHRTPTTTTPTTDVHTLALVGAESLGLLDLTDLKNPAAATFPQGTKADWNSFSLNKDTGAVEYVGAAAGPAGGRWVAFPSGTNGEWSVKWKSTSAWTIEVYMPVNVVYEEVE